MILKFLYSPEVRSYLLDLKVRAFLRKHRGRQVSKNKGQIGKINQMSKKSKNASDKEQVTKKKKKKAGNTENRHRNAGDSMWHVSRMNVPGVDLIRATDATSTSPKSN